MEKIGPISEGFHQHTIQYMRTSRAIGVLWGVFTVCFTVINIVVFIQPQWIGDTNNSKGTGYFGLWQWCVPSPVDGQLECKGQLDDLDTLLSSTFQAATILIGLSVVVTLLCVCCFLLFFFFSTTTVFYIAGCLQVLAALLLLVGTVVFPLGFSAAEVREVCGPTARQFNVGECELRWAFLLAMIGILDAIVLAALAFVLASRNVKMQPPPEPLYAESVYKGVGGQINPEFVGEYSSIAGSRKSLNLQPVMLMPQPEHDRFSEFSHHTNRSRPPHNGYRGPYASPPSLHNYQL